MSAPRWTKAILAIDETIQNSRAGAWLNVPAAAHFAGQALGQSATAVSTDQPWRNLTTKPKASSSTPPRASSSTPPRQRHAAASSDVGMSASVWSVLGDVAENASAVMSAAHQSARAGTLR